MGKLFKKETGITLIALVITIVILIILAGVTFSLALGENGLIAKVKEAKEKSQQDAAIELLKIKMMNCQVESYGEKGTLPTLAYLAAYLQNDKITKGDIEYVEMQSKTVASIDETPYESWDKIYTKLARYPYEFTIDSSFKVALNGDISKEVIPVGYMKTPDEDAIIEITENGENIDVLNYRYAKVNVTGSGSSSLSTIISSVSFSTDSTPSTIKLNITANSTDSSKILGYHVFAVEKNNSNNLYYNLGKTSSIAITQLTPNTTYNVYVIAYDTDNNYRKSDIAVVTTPNEPIKLVPTLTSNTSGGGTAFATYTANGRSAYEAFDGQIPPNADGNSPGYMVCSNKTNQIGYDFGEGNSHSVTRIVYYGHPRDNNVTYTTITLQYSDTGDTDDWHDVQSFNPVRIKTYTTTSDLAQTFNVTNETSSHRYWRVNCTNDCSWSGLLELEFWGF